MCVSKIAAGRAPVPNSDSAADLISCPRCGHAVSISTQAWPGPHQVHVGFTQPPPRFQAVHARGDLHRSGARITGILDPEHR